MARDGRPRSTTRPPGRSGRRKPSEVLGRRTRLQNEPTLAALVERLDGLAGELDAPLECVFVVDGSPDGSCCPLGGCSRRNARFSSQLIVHSRNFGSFSAVRTGLAAAKGDYLGSDGGRPPGAGVSRPRLLSRAWPSASTTSRSACAQRGTIPRATCCRLDSSGGCTAASFSRRSRRAESTSSAVRARWPGS